MKNMMVEPLSKIVLSARSVFGILNSTKFTIMIGSANTRSIVPMVFVEFSLVIFSSPRPRKLAQQIDKP